MRAAGMTSQSCHKSPRLCPKSWDLIFCGGQAVICWENYMPLLRAAMYAKGTQIYCAPTADDRETWVPTMRHIALESRCFVLSACQYIRRGDYPVDYPAIQGDDPRTVLMRGGSLIVSPLGRV